MISALESRADARRTRIERMIEDLNLTHYAWVVLENELVIWCEQDDANLVERAMDDADDLLYTRVMTLYPRRRSWRLTWTMEEVP